MKKKNSIKLVIFDFDGCIANPEEIVRKIANEMIKKYVKTNIDVERIARKEGMRSFIRKSGIRYWRIPYLVRKFRKNIAKEFYKVKPYKAIPNLIKKLDKDYILAIATSNSKNNVNLFLKKHKLAKNFKSIRTNISLFTKAWWLRALRRKHKAKKSETIMIGDELRDIKAAKKAGIISIAVTWGLNTKKVLKQANPDYIAEKPSEILKIIKRIK